MEELLDIFWEIVKSQNYVGSSFIKEYSNIYAYENGFEDYLKNVIVKRKCNSGALGRYHSNIFTIKVYYESLIEEAQLIFNQTSFFHNLKPFEQYFYRNLILMSVVQHELTHASDNKIKCEGTPGLEKYLIYAGFHFYKPNEDQTESPAYFYSPLERRADIASFENLAVIFEPLFNYVSGLEQYFEHNILKEMLMKYDESSICPTERFLKLIGDKTSWERFEFYSPNDYEMLKKVSSIYSLDDRLNLGLPISNKEYIYFRSLINKRRY